MRKIWEWLFPPKRKTYCTVLRWYPHTFFLNQVSLQYKILSVFGSQLIPQVYWRMPQRLARRLSAGFQDKESKPQVGVVCKRCIDVLSHAQHFIATGRMKLGLRSCWRDKLHWELREEEHLATPHTLSWPLLKGPRKPMSLLSILGHPCCLSVLMLSWQNLNAP